jgi:hypothetical protein
MPCMAIELHSRSSEMGWSFDSPAPIETIRRHHSNAVTPLPRPY